MATLSVLTLLVLFWIVTAALFYRLLVATLRVVGALPVLGNLIGASSTRGTDTFRFALGRLFCWSVSVNRQRGTLTGSIQIDGARRWGVFGVLVACVAAVAVPLVAAVSCRSRSWSSASVGSSRESDRAVGRSTTGPARTVWGRWRRRRVGSERARRPLSGLCAFHKREASSSRASFLSKVSNRPAPLRALPKIR